MSRGKSDLEDKVFKLKDINKNLKGKQLKLEETLKKAQWEASYFRKKSKIAEKKRKKSSISNLESNALNKMVGVLQTRNEEMRAENLKLRNTARRPTNPRAAPRRRTQRRPVSARKHHSDARAGASTQALSTQILAEVRETLQKENNQSAKQKQNRISDADQIAVDEVRRQLKEKHAQIQSLTSKYQ